MTRTTDQLGWTWLLGPCKLSDYLDTYFERSPLHIPRNDCDYYQGLLSIHELGELIASHLFQYPSIRLVKDEKPLPPARFTREVPAPGGHRVAAIDPERVMAEYRDGSTVVVPSVNRHWRPLALLCRQLKAESGFDRLCLKSQNQGRN